MKAIERKALEILNAEQNAANVFTEITAADIAAKVKEIEIDAYESALMLAARGDKLPRSTWGRAVLSDALDFAGFIADGLRGGWIDPTELQTRAGIEKVLLNGASSWSDYSWGGCALCYNDDIAAHYCTPSELKKTRNGCRRPNSREEWLDVQARALYQAARKIKNAAENKLVKAALADLIASDAADIDSPAA